MNEIPDGVILAGCILFVGVVFYVAFLMRLFRFLLKILDAIIHANKDGKIFIERNSNKVAQGTSKHIHPCAGQCENPDIILNKSPTPKYQYNDRVLDKFSPKSGRYYRGKQRKHIW